MKERIVQQEWDVEDAFFGALLGAVFGVVIQEGKWFTFPLLVVVLGGDCGLVKKGISISKGIEKMGNW